MKPLVTLFICVMYLLCISAGFAAAQTTVTVTDADVPLPAQPHSQSFSTTLNATLTNPPVTGAELTVNIGPTWSWSVSPSSPFTLSGTSTATATLSDSTIPLPAGENNLSVTATASYVVTNDTTHVTSTVSYSSSPCEVSVMILVPTSFTATLDTYGTVTTGPTAYGHASIYYLICNSNDPDRNYVWGSAVETLENAAYNSLYKSGIVANGGVGTGNSFPLNSGPIPGLVIDSNAMFDWNWPAPLGGTNTGYQTFWASCDQQMSVNDVSPPTVLNTFVLDHYQQYCLRQ